MYDIGDTLTVKEFNKIITLLAKNKTLKEQFNIKNEVTTSFGKLEFTFDDYVIFTSKGILFEGFGEFTVRLTETQPNTDNKITLTYFTLSNYEVEDVPTAKKTVERTITLTPDTDTTVTVPTADIIYLNYDAIYTVEITQGRLQLPNEITVEMPDNILQENETGTLTIKGLLNTGNPLRNEPLTITSSLLSDTTATLDNTGTATITATGNGEGTIYSNIFTLDNDPTITTDYQIICPYTNTFFNQQNRIMVLQDSEGIFLQNTSSSIGYYLADINGATTIAQCIQYTTPFIMEFIYLGHKGTVYIQIYDGTNEPRKSTVQLGLKKGDRVLVYCDETEIRYYRNGTLTATDTVTLSTFRIGLRLQQSSTLKYKDLYIYNATVI